MIKEFIEEDIMFLRKSRGDGDFSTEEVLKRHEIMLQDVALKILGHKIDEKNIYREIVSGGEEDLTNRPEFLKVLKRLESGTIRHVFVYDLARLSRQGIYGAGDIINAFLYTDTKIATLTRTYDLSIDYDRKFVEHEMLNNNSFLEYTKTVLQNGLKQSLAEGKFIGNEPPFGYDKEKLKKEKGYKLIVNNEEAEIVKMIFEMYLEDMSTIQLANYLNKHGYKPRKNDHFEPNYVRLILTNPTYYGDLRWQKRKQIKVLENGKIIKKIVSNKEPILIKGLHEPIISKELFDDVQSKMKSHRCSKVPRSSEIKNPLAGLITCSVCGYAMIRKKHSQRQHRTLERTHFLDKEKLNALIQNHKKNSVMSLSEIGKELNVSKSLVGSWLTPQTEKANYSKSFADNWHRLKEIFKIESEEFDEAITTFKKRDEIPLILTCSSLNCSNVSCYLELVEKRLIKALELKLKEYNYYIDNYEEEIIKEAVNNKKALDKIDKKMDLLSKELKNNRRAYNREEFSYEEYQETKEEIEKELKTLEDAKQNLLSSEDEDKIIRYKKAIPILANCVKNYNKLSISDKNNLLKSIIKNVEYKREKGGRWCKGGQDNFELKVNLKI